MTYLSELRLRRLASLMRGTQLSVAEAARRVGFARPGYAAQLFRQRWGVTPRDYRDFYGVQQRRPPWT